MHILDPYYYPDFNIDLVEQIQSLDKACDYTPFKGSPTNWIFLKKLLMLLRHVSIFMKKMLLLIEILKLIV